MDSSKFIAWIKSWDLMAIFYGVVSAFVVGVALQSMGVFGKICRKYKHYHALKKYRATIAEECGLLIVIGRRKGFKIQDVYVPLDLAVSDLMQRNADAKEMDQSTARAHVLVGGPGAGKSTTVKQTMLDALSTPKVFPIFLRLRDYVGFNSLEEYISHKFEVAGFEDSIDKMHSVFQSGHTICVLDGLDEVRPNLRDKVIADINGVYHKYFLNRNKLVVTCRKEAYRSIPLDIPLILEVRPLTDQQIKRLSAKWPNGFPAGKSVDSFWRDLAGTPRILELARSPLLLVGGLMQYTESNTGIPEERFEYLARVAKWLTVEWATAQGHPPDQYRQVYDRILARLAYYLHNEQRTDIDRIQAEELFATWLPSFGRGDIVPIDMIDAIAMRTGILVSDDKNHLVFSQFGLQEYFASLDVLGQVGLVGLAGFASMDWWR